MISTSRAEKGTRTESATVSSEDGTAGEDGTGEDDAGGRVGRELRIRSKNIQKPKLRILITHSLECMCKVYNQLFFFYENFAQ